MIFQRRFKLLTYATALWAFLALVATGQLHIPAILIFLTVVLFAVLRDETIMESSWLSFLRPIHKIVSFPIHWFVWLLISLTAFVIAIYGWYGIGDRMYSVTYLFFYLELNKLLTAKTNRDYIQIYALTFFHMLAASVSTDSFVFGIMLSVYLYLILEVLTTFTIKRDVEAAFEIDDHKPADKRLLFKNLKPYRLVESDSNTLRKVMNLKMGSFEMFGFRLVLIVAAIGLGMAIFWVIPRTSGKNFVNPGLAGSAGSGRKSGFADTVQFGGVGQIQLDPTIIMRAEPQESYMDKRPELLRIRGTSLDFFSNNRWSKSSTLIQQTKTTDVDNVNFKGHLAFSQSDFIDRLFSAKLTLEPETSRYFFTVNQPYQVRLPDSKLLDVDAQSYALKLMGERYDKMTYTVTGVLQDQVFLRRLIEITNQQYEADELSKALLEDIDLERFTQQENSQIVYTQNSETTPLGEMVKDQILDAISNLSDTYSERLRQKHDSREQIEFLNNYLRFPQKVNRESLELVAREWIGESQNPLEQAFKIEQNFKLNFDYSLENSFANREDHIEYFLTEVQEGHCEYFATTMVLMLRSLDIPARIVNGYISDEWSAGQNRYIIRQEHAHSWVEVYATIDLGDEVIGGWITFDPTPSSGIGRNRTSITWYHKFSSMFDSVRMFWYEKVVDYNMNDQRAGLFATLRALRNLRESTSSGVMDVRQFLKDPKSLPSAKVVIFIIGGLIVVALLVLAAFKWRSILAAFRKNAKRSEYEIPIDLKPFITLMKELEKYKPRLSGETPKQYAVSISQELTPELEELVPITEAYYKARYDQSKWTQDDQVRLNRLEQKWKELKPQFKKAKS